jgi:hypothetical protein
MLNALGGVVVVAILALAVVSRDAAKIERLTWFYVAVWIASEAGPAVMSLAGVAP